MTRARKCEGFTLIEVLLVILLLSLTAAMTAPRFRAAWSGIQYDRSVTRFVNVIRYARNQSRIDKNIYRLVYQPRRHCYYLERKDTGIPSSRQRFSKITSRYGYEIKLADTIELEAAHDQLVIFPGGTTSGGRFEFTRAGQDKKVVRVTMLTGQVSVE